MDAPCTSTGTIRRHPDVAWLRQESDVTAMTALQQRLRTRTIELLFAAFLVGVAVWLFFK